MAFGLRRSLRLWYAEESCFRGKCLFRDASREFGGIDLRVASLRRIWWSLFGISVVTMVCQFGVWCGDNKQINPKRIRETNEMR